MTLRNRPLKRYEAKDDEFSMISSSSASATGITVKDSVLGSYNISEDITLPLIW